MLDTVVEEEIFAPAGNRTPVVQYVATYGTCKLP
jgi:hypothetical protein